MVQRPKPEAEVRGMRMIRVSGKVALKTICCVVVVVTGCSRKPAPDTVIAAATLKPTPENASRLNAGQRAIAIEESEGMRKAVIWRADGQKWAQDEFFSDGLNWPAIKAGTEIIIISDDGKIEDPWRMVKASASDVLIGFDLRDGNFSPDKPADHTFLIERKNLRSKQ
jgi:hypothetical protein